MAAIDKIYIYNYEDFVEFKIWCLMHCKKALPYFYDFFMSYTEWNENKLRQYESDASDYKSFFATYKEKNDLYEFYLNSYRSMGDNRADEVIMAQTTEEWDEMIEREKRYDTCAVGDIMREDFSIPIANLPDKLDRYLLWYCPLDFIRGYLKENCGYETKWYHKIFFKN